MDQLVKDFYHNLFPGFDETVTLEDSILATRVPVVDLDLNINVNKLLEISKDIHIETVIRERYPYEKHSRIPGWQQKMLWSEGTQSTLINDVYYQRIDPNYPVIEPDDQAQQIQNELLTYGLDLKTCWLSTLEPKGYIRPHRDIGLLTNPLSYFWLPLENPPLAELKIYPYGTVDVKLGHIYLLNQESFVHSAINMSNIRRHVIIGHLKEPNDQLKTIITNSIKSQYQIG